MRIPIIGSYYTNSYS